MTDYFKDNPRILCPVCIERTFRKFGIDKSGNNREYTQCMECTKVAWFNKNVKK